MIEIIPRLFLGGWVDAKNRDLLAETGITHVVNAHGTALAGQDTTMVFHVDVYDYEDSDVGCWFTKVNRFIHNARLDGESRVLVHCAAGKSRSVALVLSYLAQKHKMRYDEARACLKAAGADLGQLNPGFVVQLKDRIRKWEDNRLQETNKERS